MFQEHYSEFCRDLDIFVLNRNACKICLIWYVYGIFMFVSGATTPGGPGRPHSRGFYSTLNDTSVGRTPLDD